MRQPLVLLPALALLFSSVAALNKEPPSTFDGLYCSPRSCYDILQVEEDAPASAIRKSYRKLSLKYHPDKTNNDKEASDMFQRIATAYQILSDPEMREDYDYYLDHPDEAIYNRYRYYRQVYATKTDARLVVIGFLLFCSGFQYFVQANRYKEAKRYFRNHNKELRQRAKDMARERVEREMKGQSGKRYKNMYRTKMATYEEDYADQLSENIEIQGGYRQASVKDLLIVHIIKLPYTLATILWWNVVWYYRFSYKGEEYGVEEKLYLTARAVGKPVDFLKSLDAEQLDDILSRELWIRKGSPQDGEDESTQAGGPALKRSSSGDAIRRTSSSGSIRRRPSRNGSTKE